MDREKVIKDLLEVREYIARKGHDLASRKCRMMDKITDALSLLKEQEHEVCENCPYKLEDIGDFSDGYHTFNDLYMQRAVLFATIVNQNLDKAWKSRRHEDGKQCFGGGWFIVGVDTPKGSYTYHYHKKYILLQCIRCCFYIRLCFLME